MPNLDERLSQRMSGTARPVDELSFDVLDRRRQRRHRRRSIGTAVLATTVVAASIGAFAVARSRYGDDREGHTPIEDPGASPSPAAEEPGGVDIGLEFRLCDVQRLGGLDFLGDGTRGVAWTGSPVKDSGRCSNAYDAKHVVAVDHDGDGSADTWTDLPVCTGCEPYDATDLGGDGTAELVVLLQYGSTPQYGVFDVVADGLPRSAGVYPVFVGPPGAPDAGLGPGEPVTLWAGGDEGFSAAIECEKYPRSPELVVAWSLYSIPDAESNPAATEEFHLTRLRLEESAEAASFIVVETASIERPYLDDLPFEQPARACGVDWAL